MSTLFNRLSVSGQATLVDFKGDWNATSNTPTLVSSTGTIGEMYRVGTAGSTTLDGVSGWLVDDYVYFDGSAWQKDDHNNAGGGEALAATLVLGNATGGTNLEVTSGDEVQGEDNPAGAGNDLLIRGGDGGAGNTDGGDVVITPGAGSGTGVAGEARIAGDLNVTGKLTVAGLIDPTGLVLTQAAQAPTGASEGAIFVSDGSSSLLTGEMYYRPGSNGTSTKLSPAVQTNVVYMSAAGNDSSSGLSPNEPKLTLGSAITAASGLSPATSNRVTIHVMDAETYTSGGTLPDFVSLYAPAATFNLTGASITLGDGSSVVVHRAISTVTMFSTNGSTTETWIKADRIEAPSAVSVQTANSLTLDVPEIVVSTGSAVSCLSGSVRGRVGRIHITGAGFGLAASVGCTGFNVTVEEITDTGSGTALVVSNTITASVVAASINTNVAYDTSSNGTLNLIVGELSGSVAGSGTANVLDAGAALPVEQGGTGADTAGEASVNLGHQVATSGFGARTIDWTATTTYVVTSGTGPITFTFTAPPNSGTELTVVYIQDGGGGNTVTWPGTVNFQTGSSGIPESGGGEATVFKFIYLDLLGGIYVAWQIP